MSAADHKEANLDKLVNKMQVQLSMPEDIIITQGDDASVFLLGEEDKTENDVKMYIIARGHCEVYQKNGAIVAESVEDDE